MSNKVKTTLKIAAKGLDNPRYFDAEHLPKAIDEKVNQTEQMVRTNQYILGELIDRIENLEATQNKILKSINDLGERLEKQQLPNPLEEDINKLTTQLNNIKLNDISKNDIKDLTEAVKMAKTLEQKPKVKFGSQVDKGDYSWLFKNKQNQ